MDSTSGTLTTTEAAVAAGVSLPQINRVIDEQILPAIWYSTSPTRSFRADACLFIAFYYETADWLTASARLQTIRNAAAHQSSWSEWRDYSVEGNLFTLKFHHLWKAVDERLTQLAEAEQMVVEDPEILSGTPVIGGTRVPVHQLAALFQSGSPMEEILEMYPSVTASQVKLASVYAKAVPQRGRPKRLRIPAGAKLISTISGSLKDRAN